MYKIKTSYGVIHQEIKSWKEWYLDENFIEFDQKGDLLIIPKNQILTIYR